MKIVVLDGNAVNPGDLSWEGFEALGDVTVYNRTPREEIVARIGDAKIVLINKTPITGETLDACPGVQYVGVLATGYNMVDTEAARERGIPVCNIPSYGTAAVAQFTIALLMEICCCVAHHDQAARDGRWENSIDFCFWDRPLMELCGKTMGVVGFGRIGQATARIAKALGMRILAYNRSQSEEGRALAEYVPLDVLLSQSDVVSLHCPLTPETEGLICRDTIAQMKDGAILLNTARGQLVNDQDLAQALDSGKLRAAGLDVVSVEPIRGDNPLLRAKNCIITPHIAWAARETRQRLMDIAVENLRAFLAGKPVNVVNP